MRDLSADHCLDLIRQRDSHRISSVFLLLDCLNFLAILSRYNGHGSDFPALKETVKLSGLYLREVYGFPSSPLPCNFVDFSLFDSAVGPDALLANLRSVCLRALDILEKDQPETVLDDLIQHQALLKDLSQQQFMCNLLAEEREYQEGSLPMESSKPALHTSILVSLFEQHFGELQKGAGTSTPASSASSASVESACRAFYGEGATAYATPPDSDEGSDAQSRLSEEVERYHNHARHVSKSDEKLKWLSGETAETRKQAFWQPVSQPHVHQTQTRTHRMSGSGSSISPLLQTVREDADSPITPPRNGLSSSQRKRVSSAESAYSISNRDSESNPNRDSSIYGAPSITSQTRLLPTPSPAPLTRATTSPPSPRPFSDLHDLTLTSTNLNLNQLTLEERRALVRKSRKLQKTLGAALDEDAAQKTLVASLPHRVVSDPPLPSPDIFENDVSRSPQMAALNRRNSYPPRSPGPILHSPPSPVRMQHTLSGTSEDCPSSLIGSFSPSSSSSSPVVATPYFYSASDPWIDPLSSTNASRQRELRRKRVQKIHALLGETLPAETILETSGTPSGNVSAASTPSKHQRSQSKIQLASGKLAKSLSMLRRRSRNAEADLVEDFEEELILPNNRDTVGSLSQAMKVESVLGETPQLMLRKTQTTHASSTRYSFGGAAGSFNPVLDKRASQLSDIASQRRSSIAQIKLLAENDTAMLQTLAHQLYGDDDDDGDRISILTRPESSMSSPTPTDTDSAFDPDEVNTNRASIQSTQPRGSFDAQNKLRSMQKVSKVLGTASPHLVRLLLQDLEEDALDDNTTSHDEKWQTISELSRLKRTLRQ